MLAFFVVTAMVRVYQTVPGTPAGTLEFFLGYGVLGVVFLLTMLGYLRPKWHSDEAARREAKKDEVMDGLVRAVERLADKLEAKP